MTSKYPNSALFILILPDKSLSCLIKIKRKIDNLMKGENLEKKNRFFVWGGVYWIFFSRCHSTNFRARFSGRGNPKGF